MATHVFTSVAANYLPKARVLATSLKRFHKDWVFHLVLCDTLPPWFSLPQEPFDSVLTVCDLNIPELQSWIFTHSLVEFSTAVKGPALQKLLALSDCSEVLYFDPDIVVLSSLASLYGEFTSASILLTPHLTEPETDLKAVVDNELSALQHGIYNFGFLGVKNDGEGRRFAGWWSDRLRSFCYDDIGRGLFTDQRWGDLVPVYFPDHKILRDPSFNVCTWNLTRRHVTGSLETGLQVNGKLLAFYHFSGFDSGAQQGMLNEYGRSMPALYELRDWYLAECDRFGQERDAQLSWAYDFFENGERILNVHRRVYRNSPELQSRFPDPFATSSPHCGSCFLDWFNQHYVNKQATHHGGLAELSVSETPSYRIFLLVTAEDIQFLPETLSSLRASTFQPSELNLIASSDLQVDGVSSPDFTTLTFNVHRYEDLFAAVLERFSDRDLLIVRAGAVTPLNWDIRLAWSAQQSPGTLSASPIDRRALDHSGTLGQISDDVLDRFCYWFRKGGDQELPAFSPDCVYLRAKALKEIVDVSHRRLPGDIADRAARMRYLNVLANHVCVSLRSPRNERDNAQTNSTTSHFLRHLRDRIRSHATRSPSFLPRIVATADARPNLHIMHSWGGGVERWLGDFARADQTRDNLVLKSSGPRGSYGSGLKLYRYNGEIEPELIHSWPLEPAIRATAIKHEEYGRILSDVYHRFGIGAIFVSTLIGHSLESLRLPVRTTLVCHDYFPFCSAINITFGEVCPSCETPRHQACIEQNPNNRFFPNVALPEWLAIRAEFLRLMKEPGRELVAPSRSVRQNYSRLMPELADRIRVIPHGMERLPCGPIQLDVSREDRLRIIVLGSLELNKGRLLLQALVPQLLEFADLILAGCSDYGQEFAENSRIQVIPSYDRENLCQLIQEFKPDLGLLPSVVPETFSYTLCELQSLGVPPVATRIGSFVDFVEHGKTGFLCEPEPLSAIALLKQLSSDRQAIEAVRRNLASFQLRTPEQMVRDYGQLTTVELPSGARYFQGPEAPEPVADRGLQLYWRSEGGNFSEEESTTIAPLGLDRQVIRLYFRPGDKPIAELRLDLSKRPGLLAIHRLTLIDPEESSIWNWTGDAAALGNVQLSQCALLDRDDSSPGAMFALTGNDPSMILPIPVTQLAGLGRGGSVEVEFTPAPLKGIPTDLLETVESERLVQYLGRQYESEVLHKSREIASRTHELEQLSAQLSAQLQQREAELQALKKSISWRITEPARVFAEIGRKIKPGS